mmetsp:Transcript_23364/g.55304  ORF Transcript_23364/g.55304 Transcript_23364/m.55304 type:complete len:801 (-) Transcript_23364:113-2515(-)
MLARDRFEDETEEMSSSPSSSHHEVADDGQDAIEGLENRSSSKQSPGFLVRSVYNQNENGSVVSKGVPIKCVGDTDDDNDDYAGGSSADSSSKGILLAKEILFDVKDDASDSEADSDDCSDGSDDTNSNGEKQPFRDEIVFDISQSEMPVIDDHLDSREKQKHTIWKQNRTRMGLDDDDETGISQARLFATAVDNESNIHLNRRGMKRESSFSLRQLMTRVNSLRNNENETVTRGLTYQNKFGKRGLPRPTALSQSFRNISLGSVDSDDSVEENYNSNIWLVDYNENIVEGEPKKSRTNFLRKKPVQACICLIVALIVISVVAFTTIKTQSSSPLPKDNNATTAEPIASNHRFDKIVELMTEMTSISSIEDLNDPATPQFKAAKFLADVNPDRLPTPMSGETSVETGVMTMEKHHGSPFDIVQRYVLLVFYFALGGDAADNGWTNQYHFASHDLSECSWNERIAVDSGNDGDADSESDVEHSNNADKFVVGVACDRELKVRQISLSNNNLEGSIPSEIQFLTTLESLDLKGNSLTGSIPEGLQDLTQLTHLDLSNNRLSGQANPLHWLGQKLVRLEFLSLSNNLLDIFDQEATSNRRDSIGGEVHLKILGLSNNVPDIEAEDERSTYSIPEEIRYLTNLQQLSLHNSNLGGRIPAWLFHELNELQFLDLSHNQLTGSITDIFPSTDGSSLPLEHLKALLFHDNKLTGTLPESIGMMPNLATVTIHHTDMTVGTDTADLICRREDETSAVESLSTDCEDPTCSCCLEICCNGEECHRDVDWHSATFSNDQQSEGSDENGGR